jgi:hypothetical protein
MCRPTDGRTVSQATDEREGRPTPSLTEATPQRPKEGRPGRHIDDRAAMLAGHRRPVLYETGWCSAQWSRGLGIPITARLEGLEPPTPWSVAKYSIR